MAQDRVRTAWSFFTAPTSILETDGLTIHEKMTYIVIAAHADRHGQAFPSYDTIATEGSMTRRHAIRCVNTLIEKGYLIKKPNYDAKGDRTSNTYTLLDVPVVTPSHHPSDSQSPPLVTPSHHPSDSQSPELNHLTDPIEQNQLTHTESKAQAPVCVDQENEKIEKIKQKAKDAIGITVQNEEIKRWLTTHDETYVLDKIALIAHQGTTNAHRSLREAIKRNWQWDTTPTDKKTSTRASEQSSGASSVQRVVPAVQPGKYERFYQVYGEAGQNKAK